MEPTNMIKQINEEIQKLNSIREKMITDPDDIHFVEYIMGLNNIESILMRTRRGNYTIGNNSKYSTVPRAGIGIDLEEIEANFRV